MITIKLPENPLPSSIESSLVDWYVSLDKGQGPKQVSEWIDGKVMLELKRCKDNLSKFVGAKISSVAVLDAAKQFANPFEALSRADIGKKFVNRSALKMCAVDSVLSAHDAKRKQKQPRERVVIVDLCGAPGGFSEYVVWSHSKRKIKCKCIGLTLGGSKRDMFQISHPSFEAHYGNIRDKSVTSKFLSVVSKNSNRGAELVMADGGFDFKGRENDQETLALPLIVSTCALAIQCVADGGQFRIKVFDMTSDGTNLVAWLVASCFERMAVIHIAQSRPANSERYLVFDGFKGRTKHWEWVLAVITADKIRVSKSAIPRGFWEFMYRVNTQRAMRQIQYLKILESVAAAMVDGKLAPGISCMYSFENTESRETPIKIDQRDLVDVWISHWKRL